MVDKIEVIYREGTTSWDEDKWLVVYPHGSATRFTTKEEAIEYARDYANQERVQPIELVIENKSGKVSRVHSYGFQ